MEVKYAKILESGTNVYTVLSAHKFIETVNGDLLMIQNDTIQDTLPQGTWIQIREIPKRVKADKSHSFFRPLKVSPELFAIVRLDPIPRTEVIKRLWAYVKRKNLIDPKNRRNILCGNDPLTKALFQKKTVSMFEMTKLVSKHLSEVK